MAILRLCALLAALLTVPTLLDGHCLIQADPAAIVSRLQHDYALRSSFDHPAWEHGRRALGTTNCPWCLTEVIRQADIGIRAWVDTAAHGLPHPAHDYVEALGGLQLAAIDALAECDTHAMITALSSLLASGNVIFDGYDAELIQELLESGGSFAREQMRRALAVAPSEAARRQIRILAFGDWR